MKVVVFLRERKQGAGQFGAWIGTDGTVTPFAGQNCLTDGAWFFPAFTSLAASDPNIALTYVGTEQRSGVGVYHLRSYRNASALSAQFSPASAIAQLTQLSTTDIYLDGQTFLPVALTFNAHPDKNALVNIPVEIDFSNYQTMNGILVPKHVQKYYQGVLLLDFQITNVAVNTGIPSSNFSIQ